MDKEKHQNLLALVLFLVGVAALIGSKVKHYPAEVEDSSMFFFSSATISM